MVRSALVTALVATTVVSAKPLSMKRGATIPTAHFPLNYKFGGQHKIATAVQMPGSNETIDVVYDQGSENFWLMAPDSIINWGCQGLACAGKCNVTETSVYDYTKSSTAKPFSFPNQYMYGMFDKLASGDTAVNDTMTFVNVAGATSTIPNVEVALEFYLQNRIGMTNGECSPIPDHDVGILGVAPWQANANRNTSGPSVRKDLLDNGQIGADVHCMWMDEAPADVYGTFTGGGLMGGIDTSKYTGPLVKVINKTPGRQAVQNSVGYYTNIPQVSVNGVTFPMWTGGDDCFLDSGTHVDDLPVPDAFVDQFLNVSGIATDPNGRLAWHGACESIPADRTIDLTWAGLNANETVTIKVPIRNYVRGNVSDPGYCSLNLQPGAGCLLAAPFQTAAFFAADDERNEIALAQGGISAIGSVPDAASVVERIGERAY